MAGGSRSQSVNASNSYSGVKLIIVLMPIIAFIGLAWLLLLKIEYLPESLSFNQDFQTWVNIWAVIFLIIIIGLLLSIPHGKGSKTTSKSVVPTKTKTKKVTKDSKSSGPSSEVLDQEEKSIAFIPLIKSDQAIATSKSDLKAKTVPMIDTTTTSGQEMKPNDIADKGILKEKSKPNIYEFPLEVEGGLYGDTFIELDSGSVLKLRTLVVKDIYLM